jgi:type 1 glutamine amidotransferase
LEISKLVGHGSLYRVLPLKETTTPVLLGSIPDKPTEPIAWTNAAGPKKARVFNTTLGHWDDFQNPAFRKMLTNAIYWALEEPYPRGQDIEKLLPAAVK